jgi:hypothetical protein
MDEALEFRETISRTLHVTARKHSKKPLFLMQAAGKRQ